MDSLLNSIRKNAVGLAIFAALTAGLIAVIQVSTKERINQNIQQARVKALQDILPADQYDNDLLQDALWFQSPELGITKPQEAFIAMNGEQRSVFFFPIQALEGYTGPISLVVGIKINGELAGVRVLQHQETPGLGDKIELKKSNWILSFNDLSLTNTKTEAWKVKKDGGQFDQFTGATITPRAIVKAVHHSLVLFKQNKDALLLAETHPSIEGAEPSKVINLVSASEKNPTSNDQGKGE